MPNYLLRQYAQEGTFTPQQTKEWPQDFGRFAVRETGGLEQIFAQADIQRLAQASTDSRISGLVDYGRFFADEVRYSTTPGKLKTLVAAKVGTIIVGDETMEVVAVRGKKLRMRFDKYSVEHGGPYVIRSQPAAQKFEYDPQPIDPNIREGKPRHIKQIMKKIGVKKR